MEGRHSALNTILEYVELSSMVKGSGLFAALISFDLAPLSLRLYSNVLGLSDSLKISEFLMIIH